jgi:hypothetical protein
LKLIVSAPVCRFADSMAARSVQWFVPSLQVVPLLSQTPLMQATLSPSPVLLTT